MTSAMAETGRQHQPGSRQRTCGHAWQCDHMSSRKNDHRAVVSVSEYDSILLRHMDDVVDTGPDEHHRAIGEMDNQMNQHIEMPQIQYTDTVADESVAVQRQVSPRNTETKAPEYIRAVAGNVQGEAITNTAGQKGRVR